VVQTAKFRVLAHALSDEALKNAFLLPHSVTFEPYVKAFKYKLLNSILYTNSKLPKIGYISDNLCSFCKQESETLQHFFYDCSHSSSFWKDYESYYLSWTSQQIHLNWKEGLIGVLTPGCLLLNYLLLLGKYIYGIVEEIKNFQTYVALNLKLI